MKLRILRRGDDPGWSRWAPWYCNGPYKREGGDAMTEVGGQNQGDLKCSPSGSEDGERGQEPRNAGGL